MIVAGATVALVVVAPDADGAPRSSAERFISHVLKSLTGPRPVPRRSARRAAVPLPERKPSLDQPSVTEDAVAAPEEKQSSPEAPTANHDLPLPDRKPASDDAGIGDAPMLLPERKSIPPRAAAGDTRPPLPERKPEIVPGRPAEPVHPRDIEAEAWSDEEMAQAAAACIELLREPTLEFDLLPPLREGACGAPAPIRVTAIGAGPAVKLSPGAIMTCPLVAALARWVRDALQPAARAHLGAPVVRLRNASAYVCRTRYDAPGGRISEHARANALDISAFETADGEIVSVLEHWHAIEAPPPPPPERAPDPPRLQTASLQLAAEVMEDAAAQPDAQDEALEDDALEDELEVPLPDAAPEPPRPAPRSLFLRRVHEAACGPFGTVLGPEANPAHADHFHFDMAARRHRAYCR